jgi:hypothetical protein
MTRRGLTGMVAAVVLGTASVWAQRPPENVSPKRHPNLAAAQRLVEHAFNRITEAQRANEWDLGGHAERAKKLLDEANEELKRAAEAANRR